MSNLSIPHQSRLQVRYSMFQQLYKKIKIHWNFYLQIKKKLLFFLLNLKFLSQKNKNHPKKLKNHLKRKISGFLIDLQKKWHKNHKENQSRKLKVKIKIECNCLLLIEIILALLALKALIGPQILLNFQISVISPKILVTVGFILNLGIYDIQSSATLQKSILVFSVPKAPRFGSGPKYAG